MALFKIFRGPEEGLNAVPCHNGYAYFTEDSGKLFVDIGNNAGDRVQVNAYATEVLIKKNQDGTSEYIDVDDLLLADAIISVANGGTGSATLTINALLVGNGTDPIKMISIPDGSLVVGNTENGVAALNGTGILYAVTAGAPQFGIAPISVGGTGSGTAAGARSNLDVYSKQEVSNSIEEVTSKTYTTTLFASGWIASGDVFTYTYSNTSIKCGKNGDVHPLITYTSNRDEYSKIDTAEATVGVGIVFTTAEKPEDDIGISIIDLG